jgi:CRP-like cAMP-binding protein
MPQLAASPDAPPVNLLDAEPDLGLLLPDARREAAGRVLLAQRRTLAPGRWEDRFTGVAPEHMGLLVLDGFLACQVEMADTVSAHMVGPGDVIRPWQRSDPDRMVRSYTRWTVVAPAELAVLDRRVSEAIAHFPEVNAMLVDRLAQQMEHIAISQAIGRLNGVDRRVLSLLWHLAGRWGRVGAGGVQLPLQITHGLLAELVGARRPTVSTAVSKLVASGRIERLERGGWLLLGRPVSPSAPTAPPIVGRFSRNGVAAR